MSSEDLPRNLRLLCGSKKSISEVCRRTEINRQQFNKYLSGASRPSAFNVEKICRFFEIDEHELVLPHGRFRDTFRRRQNAGGLDSSESTLADLVSPAFPRNAQALKRYEGFYHSYFYAFGWPNLIMRALTCLYERDDRTYVKSIERVRDPLRQDRYVMKYDGLVTIKSNRLFIVEYESAVGQSLTTSILNCTFRSRVTLLTGITIGAATGRGRIPAAGRIVYDYLGKTIDRRRALAACGAYPEDSDTIAPEIRRLVTNQISADEKVLLSLEI